MMNNMGLTKRSSIIADFFLDGAKIIFGSLVVGAFVPSASGMHLSWLAVGMGMVGVVAFLGIADGISKK